MTSLSQVLHEAVSHAATEIVLEPGRPARLSTPSGIVDIGALFDEQELFAALTQVLAPEQQAELAMGSVVEFQVDIDSGRWSLVSEPKGDMITVRGRRQDIPEAVEVGVPLELPPLEPFVPEANVSAPKAPQPVFGRAAARPTPRELERVGEGAAADDAASGAFGSDFASVRKAGSPRTASRGRRPEPASVDFELRTPAPDTDGEPHTPEPSLHQPLAEPRVEPVAEILSHETELEPTSGPQRDVLDAVSRPATLTLARAPLDALLEALRRVEMVTVIDRLELATAIDPRGQARIWVIRLEDPSPLLGWILRRLEEGASVLVESHARTGDGALRVLLGVAASERAERWVALHRCVHLTCESGRWRLHDRGTAARVVA